MEDYNNAADDTRKTRSGRNISARSGKRKRSVEAEEPEKTKSSKQKMGNEDEIPISTQLANLKHFLGKKIDNGQKKTDEAVETFKARLDANEASLSAHKIQTQNDITQLRISMDAVATKVALGASAPAAGALSYARAAVGSALPPRTSSHFESQVAQY